MTQSGGLEPEESQTEQNDRYTGKRQSFNQRWRKLTVGNQITAGSNVIIAVTTGLYVLVSILTWLTVSRSSEQTSKQVEKLVTAAKIQAEASNKIAVASERNANAAQRFSESADEIKKETIRAVEQLRRTADTAQTASQKALDASIEASRLDQRAWVSLVFPIELLDSKKIEPYVPFRFKIRFKNTGKTPAIKISYDPILVAHPITNATYPDYDVDRAGERPYMEQIGITESALLGPEEEAFITFPGQPVNAKKMAFNKELVDSINNLQTVLFIVGMVSYHDVFPGTPGRHTKFCLMYVPAKDASEIGPCPKNRTMD